MLRLAAWMLVLCAASAFAWQKKDEPSPEPPPPEPISLSLVGDRTITLDRMGMKPADFRAAVVAGRFPPLPTGLKLRITNNLKQVMRVRVTGSLPTLTLKLSGKGDPIVYEGPRPGATPLTYVLIEPGKYHEIPLGTLSDRGMNPAGVVGKVRATIAHHFPSEAGEWKLSAEFVTAIYEVRGVNSFTLWKGTLRHVLKSPAVTLTVKEK